MSDSKHTPGPWEAIGFAVYARDTGREIIFAGHNTRSGTDNEKEGNARLIAAAPELLAALTDLLHDVQRANVRDETRAAAAKAIAQAKGESK